MATEFYCLSRADNELAGIGSIPTGRRFLLGVASETIELIEVKSHDTHAELAIHPRINLSGEADEFSPGVVNHYDTQALPIGRLVAGQTKRFTFGSLDDGAVVILREAPTQNYRMN